LVKAIQQMSGKEEDIESRLTALEHENRLLQNQLKILAAQIQ